MKKGCMPQTGKIVIEENYPEPELKRPEDVKIRVRYCGVNADDYNSFRGMLGRIYEDEALFHEMSGEIAELGPVAKELGFRVGDRVTRNILSGCGVCPACRKGKMNLCLEQRNNGFSAEYAICSARSLVRLPDDISMEEGTLYWLCATCTRCVERLHIQPGDSVLILGGGAAGLMLTQLITKRMPSQITVSEPVASKRQLALRLGADVVIDPNSESVEERALELTMGQGYDIIIDASGAFSALENITDIIARGGKLMLFSNYSIDEVLRINLMEFYWKEYTIYSTFGATASSYTANSANILRHLDIKSIIDQVLPLDNMETALKMYGTGQYRRLLISI